MANTDRPRGLVPKGELRRTNDYVAGGAVDIGDAVKMEADGDLVRVAAGDDIFGVALSPATADGDEISVSTHPEQEYVCQADGADITDDTDRGSNADLVVGTPGNFQISAMELDSATVAQTSAQLTILDIDRRTDNAYGAQVDLVVKINEHQIHGENDSAGI